MGFWDEVKNQATEYVEGYVEASSDVLDAAADTATGAWDAVDDAADDFMEDQGWAPDPETGTFTEAPPEGPYDISNVPTKSEIMEFLEGFEPQVRHGMIREAAKEQYPDYGGFIDMSADEWEDYKNSSGNIQTLGGDGIGAEAVEVLKWNDDLSIVLPTVEGMQYFSAQYRSGPDPAEATEGILSEGESRGRALMDNLRSACETSLGTEDLSAICRTAEQHAKVYQELSASVEMLAPEVTKMKELGQNWEGDDATIYREQYGDMMGPALGRHSAIALNLRDAADSDLGVQVALHYAVSGSLELARIRLDELSTKTMFEGKPISVLTAAGFALGIIGLIPFLSSGVAFAVGITGLLAATGSAAGVDAMVNPKTDTLPSAAEIRNVMEDLTTGCDAAAADANALRTTIASELRTRANDHIYQKAEPVTVPGCGYEGE